jgi:hypothetical protein
MPRAPSSALSGTFSREREKGMVVSLSTVPGKQKAAQCAAFHQQRAITAYFISLASALPRSAGDFTVVTPAFSSAANLAAAVPLPPEIIAPA